MTTERKEFVLSKQILRSGTSPGAMIREAANAENGKDFVHKLAIAQKEISETQYWLELLHATNFLSLKEYRSIHSDAEEIMKMLKSSILTKKASMRKESKN